MSTPTPPNQVMGKAPTLEGRTPRDFETYISRLDAFFTYKETPDRKVGFRIMMAGNGILGDFELAAWWNAGKIDFMKMSWIAFVQELLERGLPKDYVWEILSKMRHRKQGDMPWIDHSRELRGYQTEVGKTVISDLQLVETMLFNMDPNLCHFLQSHNVLKNSGFHQSELDRSGFT